MENLTNQQLADCLCMCNAGYISPRTVMLEAARRLSAFAQGASDRPAPAAVPPESPNAPAFALASETPVERARRLARERQRRSRLSRSVTLGHAPQRDSVTAVTGGKGGVFWHLPAKKEADTAEKTQKDKDTHTLLPPARERDVSRSVTPGERDSVTSTTPPSDWRFAEWWTRWEEVATRLTDGRRVGNKATALAAWINRGWALDPQYPKSQIASWATSKEWKDRGCLPSPAKFLGDDKYTPPRKAPWKPSALIDELDADEWAAAMLDVTAELHRRELLTPPRHAVIDKAMEDRGVVKANRFWHDLVVESPTARARVLHGPRPEVPA